MKIKEGYMLREVAGNSVVVAVGAQTVDFNGLVTLNESGTFLWHLLVKGATTEELLAAMLEKYDIDSVTAQADIDAFVERLNEAGMVEA